MKYVNLEDIHDVECKINYEKINWKYARKSQNTLKSRSPSSGRPSRATPYKNGWVCLEKKGKNFQRIVVWNETNWQLTHLLENGHLITNHIGRVAWSAPIPHIRPTFNEYKPKYIKEMGKVEVDLKFI